MAQVEGKNYRSIYVFSIRLLWKKKSVYKTRVTIILLLKQGDVKMTLNKISVNNAIKKVEEQVAKEEKMSPALKAAIKVLILIVSMLAARLNLTSKNSSKSPVSDTNRKRGSTRKKSNKKPGGAKWSYGNKAN